MTTTNAEEMAGSRVTMDNNSHRILVVGKTGNGKSSVCNTLLGDGRFETGSSMMGTTLQTQHEYSTRGADNVKVIDTLDLTNCEMNQYQMQREVTQWKNLTAPYPSAILLAVRCDVRYTAEEQAIYRQIKNLWGDESSFCQRLVVAFTFGDRQRLNIEEELRTTVPAELKSVLRDAEGRYIVFNNKDQNKEWYLHQLLSLIHTMDTAERDLSPVVRHASKVLCVVAVITGLCFASFVAAKETGAAVVFGLVFAASGVGLILISMKRKRVI